MRDHDSGSRTRPPVSVITVVRNARDLIERTLDSVRAQDIVHEHVVWDGMSTDGTSELLRARADVSMVLHCGADGGIYDAMNRALALATGEWVQFLNAGDVLAGPDVLGRLIATPADVDLVYGDYERVSRDGRVVEYVRQPRTLGRRWLLRRTINHQSMLLRRSRLGAAPFEIEYPICADYDCLLRLVFEEQIAYRHVDLTVCQYDDAGVSERQRPRMMDERFRIQQRYFPAWLCRGYRVYAALRGLRR